MRQAVPFVLAATLAAPGAAATPETAAAFIDAMRDAGCEMSLETADDTADALGIEVEDLDDVLDLLFMGGLLDIDQEDNLNLTPALCEGDAADDAQVYARLQDEIDLDAAMEPFFGAPVSVEAVPTPERGALFLSAIRGNDCALHRDDADTLLTTAGLTPAEAETALVILFEAGHLRFVDGPNAVGLPDPVCSAEPAGDAALFETATAQVIGRHRPGNPDAVLAERFGPEGIEAVMAFLADTSDCVLDISDREDTVDSVVAFLAFNVTGVYNLPPDFSPVAEDELRATIAHMLDVPSPAFEAAPGQLTLIDCTP